MADKSRSLMALKSFWEGFDAAGDTLRCVVIPKLPFANPNDPLVRERELREDRSWWRYSLPEAILSVKQAAGRLIRTSTDTGILVLADSRIATKRYGQTFLKAMPSGNHTMLETRNVSRYIGMWRASHR
jgi:ATP-dependent DNA helicase DinG